MRSNNKKVSRMKHSQSSKTNNPPTPGAWLWRYKFTATVQPRFRFPTGMARFSFEHYYYVETVHNHIGKDSMSTSEFGCVFFTRTENLNDVPVNQGPCNKYVARFVRGNITE
uniref:Uncharacterized protein n=1 Tax=Cryptomonas curvata TaxID=233186 RepID=A0A7S0QQC2_9CRYP|mmetsp:Transcript_56228/g.117576  ORF Transcript_56228/g.117576 Transcript_56228/m.117576 type:complete len:112 (+) Transcript_56228:169-504(+)